MLLMCPSIHTSVTVCQENVGIFTDTLCIPTLALVSVQGREGGWGG